MKFYSACNTVFQRANYFNEPVKLQLVKWFCVTLIAYCISALNLSKMLYINCVYAITMLIGRVFATREVN